MITDEHRAQAPFPAGAGMNRPTGASTGRLLKVGGAFGQKMVMPDQEMLEQVRERVNKMDLKSGLVVPFYVTVETHGTDGQVFNVEDKVKEVKEDIVVALGLSRSLVTGDGPNFATASVSLRKILVMIREITPAVVLEAVRVGENLIASVLPYPDEPGARQDVCLVLGIAGDPAVHPGHPGRRAAVEEFLDAIGQGGTVSCSGAARRRRDRATARAAVPATSSRASPAVAGRNDGRGNPCGSRDPFPN